MSHVEVRFGDSGPILDVLIGISHPLRVALAARKFDIPPPLKVPFIIDTGATTTMISEQHMRTLGIQARGMRDILTATSDERPTQCNTYDVSLTIATFGDPPFVIPALEVLGRPLFNHSIEGMIGRDVLNRVGLHINGPGKRFRITY